MIIIFKMQVHKMNCKRDHIRISELGSINAARMLLKCGTLFTRMLQRAPRTDDGGGEPWSNVGAGELGSPQVGRADP